MLVPLVMLAQQIFPVIVSVRRAHNRVDVVARRGGRPGWRHPRLVVEFDQDHRAFNTVIKDAARVCAPDPGEVRLVEAAAHFIHPHTRVTVFHIADVFRDQFQQQFLLLILQLGRRYPGVIEHEIVFVCLRQTIDRTFFAADAAPRQAR